MNDCNKLSQNLGIGTYDTAGAIVVIGEYSQEALNYMASIQSRLFGILRYILINDRNITGSKEVTSQEKVGANDILVMYYRN